MQSAKKEQKTIDHEKLFNLWKYMQINEIEI